MESFFILVLFFGINQGPGLGSFAYMDPASFPTRETCEAFAAHHRSQVPKDRHPVIHRCIEVSGPRGEQT